MADCNPAEQERRQALLDEAYLLDGRNSPDHPHHCTYTALAETDVYRTCRDAQPGGTADGVVG